jgi:hypothetical protein
MTLRVASAWIQVGRDANTAKLLKISWPFSKTMAPPGPRPMLPALLLLGLGLIAAQDPTPSPTAFPTPVRACRVPAVLQKPCALSLV